MKKIILGIFICFSVLVLAQSNFTVDGKSYSTNEVQKEYTYEFGLNQAGTFDFLLEDSATTWVNYDNQIKLTEQDDIAGKAKYHIITYFSRDGQDSLVSYYKGKKLVKYFSKTLDRYGRVRSTDYRDYEDPKQNKAYNYLYKDTIVDDWKIASQYVYATYARQFRSFNRRLDSYVDEDGDTVKIVTVTNTQDSTVAYPARKFSFRRNRYLKRSGNIDYFEQVEILPEEFQDKERLMSKYLEPVKYKFTDYRYNNLKYNYYNADRSIDIRITKTDAERSVVLTQKIKQ